MQKRAYRRLVEELKSAGVMTEVGDALPLVLINNTPHTYMVLEDRLEVPLTPYGRKVVWGAWGLLDGESLKVYDPKRMKLPSARERTKPRFYLQLEADGKFYPLHEVPSSRPEPKPSPPDGQPAIDSLQADEYTWDGDSIVLNNGEAVYRRAPKR